MGMIAISFPSCTGILGGLYDKPSKDFGFIEDWGNSGTIYLDCDNKTEWIYIDLKNRKYEACPIAPQYGFLPPRTASTGVVHLDVRDLDEWCYLDFDKNQVEVRSAADGAAGEPENWDLAVHHFDFKTNGAKVALTEYTSDSDLVWAFNPEIKEPNAAEGEMIPAKKLPKEFIPDEEKAITVADGSEIKSLVNPLLSTWAQKVGDFYSTGKFVYAVRLKDNSLAILKLLGVTDTDQSVGVLTLHYTLLDENWRVTDAEHLALDTSASGETAVPVSGLENWDFAIHRYDCKTNNARVVMTDHKNFESLIHAGEPADETFQGDEEGYVLYDMSYMMSGAMINVDAQVNPVLNTWLDVDMSSMPPVYTPKKNIFLAKKEDGTYFALQLVKYGSGLITMNYFYPVEFN